MKIGYPAAVLIAVVAFVLPASLHAAAEDAPGAELIRRGGDIEEFRLIHADTMTLTRQKEKPQVFQGSVDIVLRDEAGEETGIKADKITIFYEQDLKEIRKIEAEGKVEIARLGTLATADLAVYDGEKNTIELLENPHIKDSRGELNADKITVYLDTDDVVAEGNVRGIVYTEAFEETRMK